MRPKVICLSIAFCCLSSARVYALEVSSVPALLDSYSSGDFDGVVRALDAVADPKELRSLLLRGADEWIALSSADVTHRRLVAASLALEVAHARLSHDVESVVIFLDWSMRTLRKQRPVPAERFWTLAAVALVERAVVPGIFPRPALGSTSRWIPEFIDNAIRRFPDEPRLLLARLMLRGGAWVDIELEKLAARDSTLAGDVFVERAYLQLSRRNCSGAVQHARTALERALEAPTKYVAHFLIGYCHQAQGRPQDAVQEYGAALRAVPEGQSATIALSLLLLANGQAQLAFDLIDRSMTLQPNGDDPWRLFAYRGYVRWPVLIADVRRAVH